MQQHQLFSTSKKCKIFQIYVGVMLIQINSSSGNNCNSIKTVANEMLLQLGANANEGINF